MPNLGRLGGDPALGALQFSSEATLADLPGLIEGAHLGKVLLLLLCPYWFYTKFLLKFSAVSPSYFSLDSYHVISLTSGSWSQFLETSKEN